MNRYFKASILEHTDEELVYNTFWLYIATIATLIALVIDQGEWNLFTVIATVAVCIILFRFGYRVGSSNPLKRR